MEKTFAGNRTRVEELKETSKNYRELTEISKNPRQNGETNDPNRQFQEQSYK